ncbi:MULTISPECIES: YlmC/YmxH family sporulation protein [Diplocloster]|uniref:YlmC/YmxH family sporulation protein n=1 Tax=Diplocloster modestus TaxID=2850322 RepID=A0ABS6KEF0_9FIRM|nr:YlmC/YmxH family sporulation protein [Diplocloster modestus]MBU9728910.1 YlmC/YmxH family sporulation protein [Diplocloster modestus]
MRVYELKQKEVINICDCARLGCVIDIDFDIKTGCVRALIIPGPGKGFCLFGRDMEYVIPWCQVKQIGADIILVDVDIEKVLVKCGI